MRKLILILMIFQIVIVKNNLCAQSTYTFTAEKLEGKEWYIKFPDADYKKRPAQGICLVGDTLISFLYSNGVRNGVNASYYLSTTLDKTFVKPKIGKCKSGQYLIISDSSGVICAQILNLTETDLVLHCLWMNRQLSFTTKRPD